MVHLEGASFCIWAECWAPVLRIWRIMCWVKVAVGSSSIATLTKLPHKPPQRNLVGTTAVTSVRLLALARVVLVVMCLFVQSLVLSRLQKEVQWGKYQQSRSVPYREDFLHTKRSGLFTVWILILSVRIRCPQFLTPVFCWNLEVTTFNKWLNMLLLLHHLMTSQNLLKFGGWVMR